MWKKTKLITFLLLFLSLSSCGLFNKNPERIRNRKKAQVERLIKTYRLDKDTTFQERVDTVFRYDTLNIPEIRLDTQFMYKFDTTYVITQDGVLTQLEIRRDTVHFNTTVFERDTVYQINEVTKIIEKTVPLDLEQKKVKVDYVFIMWWILLALIIVMGFVYGRKIIKDLKEIKNEQSSNKIGI